MKDTKEQRPWEKPDVPRNTLLENYIIDFCIAKKDQGLRELTLLTYWSHLSRFAHFAWMYGLEDPKEFDEIRMGDRGGLRGYLGLYAGGHTVNANIRTVNSFYSWLYQTKKIPEPIRFGLNKVDRPYVRCFDTEEIGRLVAPPAEEASFGSWRDWAIVRFVLSTGARRSNVLDLRVRDLDLGRRTVVLEKTKSRRSLRLPLTKPMVETLRLYLSIRRPERPDDFVFCTDGGGQMTVSQLRRRLDRYYLDRGVSADDRKSGCHILRHTFARHLARKMPTALLQQFMGHSHLATTEAYIHFTHGDLQEAADEYDILAAAPRVVKPRGAKRQ